MKWGGEYGLGNISGTIFISTHCWWAIPCLNVFYYFLAKFLNRNDAYSSYCSLWRERYVNKGCSWRSVFIFDDRMVTPIFPLALATILLGRLHMVITSRKTHWARKHLDYKSQVYQTLTRRAFLKTKKIFWWTNFINGKVILKNSLNKKNENFARSRSMLAYFAQKLPRIVKKLTRKNAFQARKLLGNF